jgi:hypothetical protein
MRTPPKNKYLKIDVDNDKVIGIFPVNDESVPVVEARRLDVAGALNRLSDSDSGYRLLEMVSPSNSAGTYALFMEWGS